MTTHTTFPSSARRGKLPPLTPLALLLELALILIATFLAARPFLDFDPQTQLPGSEAEWLTSSAYLAAQTLHTHGYLPNWQPYQNLGEPLLDNPFAFMLNPLLSLPVLAYGGAIGVKVGVALTALAAALGGWALGRVLGLGTLGRLLLALLCLGKGNMHAMIGAGYFQLGVSQAYMPWVFAGMLAVLRTRRNRWPMVLTAVSFALMFWAGNIWYTLPTLFGMVGLTLLYIIRQHGPGPEGAPRWWLDWPLVRRAGLMAALMLGLSAITFLPIWFNQGRIGGHPSDPLPLPIADAGKVLVQFFNGDLALYNLGQAPGEAHFYYSFVLPAWFAALIFLLLPPVRALYRPALPDTRRVAVVGAALAVFCYAWGAGGNPIIGWLYQTIPFFGQWRFVGRALAVTSFWLAVLAAMRVDGLWRAVVLDEAWRGWQWLRGQARQFKGALRAAAAVALVALSLSAAGQVVAQWNIMAAPGPVNVYDDVCITWLRRQFPNRELAVYGPGYSAVSTYMKNRVRLYNIAADFRMIPDRPTIFQGDLTLNLPEFGLAWEDSLRAFFGEQGYTLMTDSPRPVDSNHCLYRKTDVMPYAFSIQREALELFAIALPVNAVTPLAPVQRLPDVVTVLAEADPTREVVVTISEIAYPGWSVTVDGAAARRESVGGLNGVVLPPGEGTRTVVFQFRSPLLVFGRWLTLLTAIFCIVFVARAERLLPPPLRSRLARVGVVGSVLALRVRDFMLNPDILAPADEDEPPPRLPELPARATLPDEVIEGQIVDIPPPDDNT